MGKVSSPSSAFGSSSPGNRHLEGIFIIYLVIVNFNDFHQITEKNMIAQEYLFQICFNDLLSVVSFRKEQCISAQSIDNQYYLRSPLTSS